MLLLACYYGKFGRPMSHCMGVSTQIRRNKWAPRAPVPILIFLDLSVLDLGPMYATDRRHTSGRRQTDRRQTKASLNATAY